MKKICKFTLIFFSILSLILGTASTSFSKVEGDKIILGAAVSLTGKYSTNGKHTKNGYNCRCAKKESRFPQRHRFQTSGFLWFNVHALTFSMSIMLG